MELQGKIIHFLGDSITQGYGASEPDKIYHQLIKQKYGLAEANNFGIGGTCLADRYTPLEIPEFNAHFVTRIEQMPLQADAIVVFGGTNDFGHGDAPMGSFGCKTNDTFWGALYTLSVDLINKYPTARIVFFTPLHRKTKPEPRFKGDGYWTLDQYADAIRTNAAYFGFPVLDLRTESGIQPMVPVIAEKFTTDGLHPNDAGYERIFRMVDRFIANLE